jgi:hypothetical protein
MDAYFCGTFRLIDRGTQGTRKLAYTAKKTSVCSKLHAFVTWVRIAAAVELIAMIGG